MGKVGLEGATAGVLSRSLQRLTTLINCSLAELRLESGLHSPERLSVQELLEHVSIGASMEASARALSFDVAPCEAGVDVHVSLTASATERRVVIEVADECGGLPPGKSEELLRPFEQRGRDRTGLCAQHSRDGRVHHRSAEAPGSSRG